MSKLHYEILDLKRKEILSLLTKFADPGILGGGTAVALHLGHRISYDFDVFLNHPLKRKQLTQASQILGSTRVHPAIDTSDELTILIGQEVKITFLNFPFPHLHPPVNTDFIPIFDLKDLASNKAYTIGRRGSWRDYVDLFFILKQGKTDLEKNIIEAEKRFGGNFAAKLFLAQLTYFGDIRDYTIDFVGQPTPTETIKNFLLQAAQDFLQRKF